MFDQDTQNSSTRLSGSVQLRQGLFRTFVQVNSAKIFILTFFYIFQVFLSFAQLVLIYNTIDLIMKAKADPNTHKTIPEIFLHSHELLFYAALITSINFLRTELTNELWLQRQKLSLKFISGVSGLIFDKCVRLSYQTQAKPAKSIILGFLHTELPQLSSALWSMKEGLVSLSNLILSLVLGVYLLKGLFLVVPGLVFGVFALNRLISTCWGRLEGKLAQTRQDRSKLLLGVFNGIDYIKMSGLENTFLQILARKRAEEVRLLVSALFFKSQISLLNVLSIGLTTAAFLYLGLGLGGTGGLNLAKIVVLVRLVTLVHGAIIQLFSSFINSMSFLRGLRAIERFFESEEPKKSFTNFVKKSPSESPYSVEIQNGSFFWDRKAPQLYKNYLESVEGEDQEKGARGEKTCWERFKAQQAKRARSKRGKKGSKSQTYFSTTSSSLRKTLLTQLTEESSKRGTEHLSDVNREEIENFFVLKNINFRVEKGAIVAITGGKKAGKSSLLQSLLGEMTVGDVVKTKVVLGGLVSYVGKQPWIVFGGSVRDNIILGAEFDADRFEECVQSAGFLEDLLSWPNAENTRIGDLGGVLDKNLRWRIALARCFYQQ